MTKLQMKEGAMITDESILPGKAGREMGGLGTAVFFIILVAIFLLNGCSTEMVGGIGPDEDFVYGLGWSAAHSDSSNSDYSPVTGSKNLALAWERKFPQGQIYLGSTSDDQGHVYVTTSAPGCHLYALDQTTGQPLWCSDRINAQAIASSALIDRDGNVYVADNKFMFGFDRDGNVLWQTPIVGTTLSAQFTPSGRIIFITHIGRIYVLDRETGEPVFSPIGLIPGMTYDPDAPEQPVTACMRGTKDCPSANTIAVDQRTGDFFFTFFAPESEFAELRAMRYEENPAPSISHLWINRNLPGGSGSSPTLSADGKRVYVNDNVDSVHAIDAMTGETIWSYAIGWASGGSPSLSPEGIIMPAGSGPLMAIIDRGKNAELLWKREELKNSSIAAQVANNLAYAVVERAPGTFENDFIVVDTRTGAVLDREPLSGKTIFSVGTTIGLDGTVYVSTINGRIFAFRP